MGHNLHVGLETILWRIKLEDLPPILDVIAACRFKGVEFAQRSDLLGIRGYRDERITLSSADNWSVLEKP
jgi:hypothetical protein